ncbi:MAG: hypothetical protein F4160_11895 [Rhodospirillaceae bacterium]|nr:hypothetical protein [Rhodospirillaceae bacterium]
MTDMTDEKERLNRLADKAFDADKWILYSIWTTEIKAKLTDEPTLPGLDVHIGSGLDHMTGLADMARAAANAGQTLPHIVMRDGNQRRVSVHHVADLEEILGAARRRENLVESAHNAVMERYHAQAKIRDDETQTLADREAAADAALAITNNYQAELKKEIAAYDPDALPADLGALRRKYIEWLEATAARQQKSLKGALTEQAIKNWAACVDMDAALSEVSKQCALASIEIDRAMTAAEAKAAYDAGAAAIRAVTAANTPHWMVDGTLIAQAFPPDRGLVGRSVAVRAVHPAGKNIDGKVAFTAKVVEGAAEVTVRSLSDPTARELVFTIPDDATAAAKIEATARNLCGPSRLVLTLTPPPA